MNLIEYVINNNKEKVLYQIERNNKIQELMECQNEIDSEIFSNLNESYVKVGYREIKNKMLNEIEDKIYEFMLNEEANKKANKKDEKVINPFAKSLSDVPIFTDNIDVLNEIISKLKEFRLNLISSKDNISKEEYEDFFTEYQTVITAIKTLKTLYYTVIDDKNEHNNYELHLKGWIEKWFDLFNNVKGIKKIVKSMVEIIDECKEEKFKVKDLIDVFYKLSTDITLGKKVKIEVKIPSSPNLQGTINHVLDRLLTDTDSSYSKSSRTVGYGECLLYFIFVLSENIKVSNPPKLDININNQTYDVKYFNISIETILVFIGDGMVIKPNKEYEDGWTYDISVAFSEEKITKNNLNDVKHATITTDPCKYHGKVEYPSNPRYVFMSNEGQRSKETGNDDASMTQNYRQELTDMLLNELYKKGLRLILVTANSTSNIEVQLFNTFQSLKGKLYCPFNTDNQFKLMYRNI